MCKSSTSEVSIVSAILCVRVCMLKYLHLSRKAHDTYNSSFQGPRRFLTALAIETVLMILNSAHYK